MAVDEMLPPSDLPYLLAESDYVVVALAADAGIARPDRRGGATLDEAERRDGRNICRGAIIDEQALVRALKEGWIAGAALDVFKQEPLSGESELWGLENVILTPHISGGTPRYMERAVGLFCDNLRRYVAGEPLRNVVHPAEGTSHLAEPVRALLTSFRSRTSRASATLRP